MVQRPLPLACSTPGTAAGRLGPWPPPGCPAGGCLPPAPAPEPGAPPPAGAPDAASQRRGQSPARNPRPAPAGGSRGDGASKKVSSGSRCESRAGQVLTAVAVQPRSHPGRHCRGTHPGPHPAPRNPPTHPPHHTHLECVCQVLVLQHRLLRQGRRLVSISRGAVLPEGDRAVAAPRGQQLARGAAEGQGPHLVVVRVKGVGALCRQAGGRAGRRAGGQASGISSSHLCAGTRCAAVLCPAQPEKASFPTARQPSPIPPSLQPTLLLLRRAGTYPTCARSTA